VKGRPCTSCSEISVFRSLNFQVRDVVAARAISANGGLLSISLSASHFSSQPSLDVEHSASVRPLLVIELELRAGDRRAVVHIERPGGHAPPRAGLLGDEIETGRNETLAVASAPEAWSDSSTTPRGGSLTSLLRSTGVVVISSRVPLSDSSCVATRLEVRSSATSESALKPEDKVSRAARVERSESRRRVHVPDAELSPRVLGEVGPERQRPPAACDAARRRSRERRLQDTAVDRRDAGVHGHGGARPS